jgi:H+/Cl- antiporter ClcA
LLYAETKDATSLWELMLIQQQVSTSTIIIRSLGAEQFHLYISNTHVTINLLLLSIAGIIASVVGIVIFKCLLLALWNLVPRQAHKY